MRRLLLVVGLVVLAGCAPAAAAPLPDEIHVVQVPEAPGMVCFVDRERRPFHCAPLWLVGHGT